MRSATRWARHFALGGLAIFLCFMGTGCGPEPRSNPNQAPDKSGGVGGRGDNSNTKQEKEIASKQPLSKLRVISIQPLMLYSPDVLGLMNANLSKDEIQDDLIVLLRTKISGVQFTQGDSSAEAILGVSVTIFPRGDEVSSWGVMSFQVHRAARLATTGQPAWGEVYQKEIYWQVPTGLFKGHTRRVLEGQVTAFAAEWYRQNP